MASPYPRDLTMTANAGIVSTSANDLSTIVGRSQTTATVNSVQYIPNAALSGANTNSRTLTLYNRGAAGASTIVAQLPLVSGTDLVDNTPKTITLSTTAANLSLSVGDILEWESLHVSSGILDPGGLVVVQVAMR